MNRKPGNLVSNNCCQYQEKNKVYLLKQKLEIPFFLSSGGGGVSCLQQWTFIIAAVLTDEYLDEPGWKSGCC